jgi:hypothetical protein
MGFHGLLRIEPSSITVKLRIDCTLACTSNWPFSNNDGLMTENAYGLPTCGKSSG